MKTYSDQPSGPALRRYSLNGATMGTRYTAIFHAHESVDVRAIGTSLFAAVDQVDKQMSNWNPASALSRLNAAPENTWIAVPPALAHVLETGLALSLQSHGAFDLGVGALVDAWGFGPSGRVLPPGSLAALDERPFRPANAILDVDRARGQVRKRSPIALDLSGIAKGYGVDQLARCLDGWNVGSYLVGIDGEMRARGVKPGGEAWAVAVEQPSFGKREVSGVMELHDAAIATSGDYRRRVEIDGKHYSHTMNPRLGRPSSNCLAAVTVLAPTCMLADAWATTLLVLGEHEGVALAREKCIDALFVVRDGPRLREIPVFAERLSGAS